MPVPRRQPRPDGGVSRRQLLGTASAFPLLWPAGGCTLSGPGGDEPATPDPAADPDVAVLRSAAAQVDALVALCARVVDERPELARPVQPALQIHRRHAEVLGSASSSTARSGTGTPTPRRTGSGAPSGAATGEPLPRGRAPVLSLLAGAEQRAAQVHRRQVRQAESGQFAQLLAAVSAAESQLETVLKQAR